MTEQYPTATCVALHYLEDRGLTLAPDKTQITHISDGFDFLGFNIRSYKGSDREKLLIKASKDSIKSFKAKAKDIIRMCYPWNLEQSKPSSF